MLVAGLLYLLAIDVAPPPAPPPTVHWADTRKAEVSWRLYCDDKVWVSLSIANESLPGRWAVKVTDLRAHGFRISPAQRAEAIAKVETLSYAVSARISCGGAVAVLHLEGYPEEKPGKPTELTVVDLLFGASAN